MIERCGFCQKFVWPWQAKVRVWTGHLQCAVEAHLLRYHKTRSGF